MQKFDPEKFYKESVLFRLGEFERLEKEISKPQGRELSAEENMLRSEGLFCKGDYAGANAVLSSAVTGGDGFLLYKLSVLEALGKAEEILSVFNSGKVNESPAIKLISLYHYMVIRYADVVPQYNAADYKAASRLLSKQSVKQIAEEFKYEIFFIRLCLFFMDALRKKRPSANKEYSLMLEFLNGDGKDFAVIDALLPFKYMGRSKSGYLTRFFTDYLSAEERREKQEKEERKKIFKALATVCICGFIISAAFFGVRYLNDNYPQIESAAEYTAEEIAQEQGAEELFVTLNAETLGGNVRSTQDLSDGGNVITVLDADERLKYLGEEEVDGRLWYKVQVDENTEGWISAKICKVIEGNSRTE